MLSSQKNVAARLERRQPDWFTPRRLLAIFCFTNFIVYLDRGLIASNGVNGSPTTQEAPGRGIQGDFALSYTQDGLLPAAFLVGLLASSPIFAEASKHKGAFRLLGHGMATWLVAVLGCAIAPNFPALLASRALVGVGEASFVALAAPFIDDYAPRNQKTRWLAYFYLCIPTGFAAGYIFGGTVTAFFSWRMAFILEGLLMVPFVIFALTATPVELKKSRSRHDDAHDRRRVGSSPTKSSSRAPAKEAGRSAIPSTCTRSAADAASTEEVAASPRALQAALLPGTEDVTTSHVLFLSPDNSSEAFYASSVWSEEEISSLGEEDVKTAANTAANAASSSAGVDPETYGLSMTPGAVEKKESRHRVKLNVDSPQASHPSSAGHTFSPPPHPSSALAAEEAIEGDQKQSSESNAPTGSGRPLHSSIHISPSKTTGNAEEKGGDDDGTASSRLTAPLLARHTEAEGSGGCRGGGGWQGGGPSLADVGSSSPSPRRSPSAAWELLHDVYELLNNALWVHLCVAYTLYVAVVGIYAYWGPKAGKQLFFRPDDDSGWADLAFGGVTVAAGVLGSVAGGSLLDLTGSTLRRACMICGGSVLVGAAVLIGAFAFSKNFGVFLLVFGIGELLIFIMQAPVAAIGLWCVPPALRPLSVSLMTVSIHLLGDVPSSPLLGAFQAWLTRDKAGKEAAQMWRVSLGVTTGLLFLSSFVFLKAAAICSDNPVGESGGGGDQSEESDGSDDHGNGRRDGDNGDDDGRDDDGEWKEETAVGEGGTRRVRKREMEDRGGECA